MEGVGTDRGRRAESESRGRPKGGPLRNQQELAFEIGEFIRIANGLNAADSAIFNVENKNGIDFTIEADNERGLRVHFQHFPLRLRCETSCVRRTMKPDK